MSLEFIFGASGAGKSHYIYSKLIEEAVKNPDRQYLVLVPEQFTMQTQKDLVSLHPRKGILNIDALSFERLAFRVLEEIGENQRELLEETGKSMVLRKVAQEKKKDLRLLGNKMEKPGYVSQMKSMVSELRQYEMTWEDLEEISEDIKEKPQLYYKLKDIQILYKGFFDYLEGKFITQEEVLDVLGRVADQSSKLKDSVVLLDGYTGFTPIQLQLLEKLLGLCQKIYVTLTIGEGEDPYKLGSPHQLFYLTKQTVHKLCKLSRERNIPWREIWVPEKKEAYRGRFAQNPALAYLEKNIFRYGRGRYPGEQEAVRIRECLNPGREMEETAAIIRRMVRKEGYRYRDFAVITGDMEEYAPAAQRAFGNYGIPCFIDQKHSIFMNPFVEYVRAAVDMAVENFSYESVFRLLRCNLTDITQEETDRLENYVVALGIRGFSKWEEEWTRSYKGQDPGECVPLNQARERLVKLWGPFYRKLKEKEGTVRSFAEALYLYIRENRIEEKLKEYQEKFQEERELSLVKEYSQIYRLVMDLLDKMTEVLGEEKVRLREFKEILDAGLSEAKVGVIPPAADQVLVGDMERTRLKDIKILFFAGVNEGKIPKEGQNGKLLSDLNREELSSSLAKRGLSLAPTAKEALYTQRFYLYLNLTKPEERVYLTYSRLNGGGEALSPSYLIRQIERLFPDAGKREEIPMYAESLQGALDCLTQGLRQRRRGDSVFEELLSWFQRQEEWRGRTGRYIRAAFYANPRDSIGKAVAKALYGTQLENSATRLEQFAKCACSHFFSYGLMLRERARYEFSMADLGTLLHDSLDLFARKIREEKLSWTELEDGKRDELAEACVDQAVQRSGGTVLLSSARNAYTVNRAKRMIKRSVWALQRQLRQGDFFPALTEWAFGPGDKLSSLNLPLSGEEMLCLKGRIDRIDLCEEEDRVYVKVIDYKSGATELDLVKFYYGLQLQLMLYLSAALELEQRRYPGKEVTPAGVFYYNIKDPVLNQEDVKDWEDPEKDMLKKLRMEGMAGAEPEILGRLDRELLKGSKAESIVVPVKYTAQGELSQTSKTASREQFASMLNYVNYKAKEIGKEILEGNTEVNPFEKQNENACEYCPYKNVCGFDEKLPGYAYRRLPALKPQELWERIEETLKEEKDREDGKKSEKEEE